MSGTEQLRTITRMEIKLSVKCIVIAVIVFFIFCETSNAGSSQSKLFPADKVRIDYATGADTELVLSAVKRAYSFFLTFGYSKRYPLRIVFQEAVMVKTGNGNLIRVYGKLGKDNCIYLTNWTAPWLSEQNAYGLRMCKALYQSIIVHEVAHFIAENIAGCKIENTLSEYIAYVVQLAQMQPHIRQAILNQNRLSAFKTEEINLEVMLLDPAVFAAKSYLHFKENNGEFIGEVLSGATRQIYHVAYWNFH